MVESLYTVRYNFSVLIYSHPCSSGEVVISFCILLSGLAVNGLVASVKWWLGLLTYLCGDYLQEKLRPIGSNRFAISAST